MLQPVSRVLLSIMLMCGLYATMGSARAQSESPAPDAGQLSPTDDDDDAAAANLTCGGHVCLSGQLCCSCRATPSSPPTSFCHTPDYCPHGSICQIPPA